MPEIETAQLRLRQEINIPLQMAQEARNRILLTFDFCLAVLAYLY